MGTFYRSNICEVDIAKPLERSHAGIVMATGDCLANRFGAMLHKDGVPVNAAGAVVTGYFIRPDGDTVVFSGNADGNTVCVDLPAACYTQEGSFSLAIKVSSDDIIHTVRVVDGYIRLTHTDTIIDPGEVVPSIDELIAKIGEMEAATEACKAATEAAGVSAGSAPAIVTAALGELVSVLDAADRPAQDLVSFIDRTTEGVSAVTLTHTGRNLLSHHDYVMTKGHSATTITDDWIDVTNPSAYDYGNFPVSLKGGVPYTIIIDWEVYGRDESATGATTAGYRITAKSENYSNLQVKANGMSRIVMTYTPDEDVETTVVWHPNYNSVVKACSRSRVMMVEGTYTTSTAPSFEPYTGQTLTAAIGGTVYGSGLYDWLTGVLTITTDADGNALATPVTRHLTPQQLTLYKGGNTFSSDTGSTMIYYIADTKLYIDNQLAAIAASIINA